MSSEINHLVNWVYREQLTRKEAELKALQSQINPHFLFNTLEAINWLAQLNNVPEISSTVSDLSDLMEGSIGRDDRLITIKEEFTYADKYISLQKRRFGDRIELVKNIQPEVNSIKIPRLLIQPLIENAVYHGIERIRGKGIITLNAEKLEDCVSIEVIDNGAGMEREDLEQLNARLSMDNDTYFKSLSDKRSKSIGIENVNRRIKLFYGENYGLKIESEAGRYTKAVVMIPFKISADGGEGYYVQSSDN
jgi:two-component system sensor histidine kinase YesM